MGDVYSVPTIDEVRAGAAGAPLARAPAPGALKTIGLSFEQAGAAPDWGLNQFTWENKARYEIMDALRKKGVEPVDPRHDGAFYPNRQRENYARLFAQVAGVRQSDPNFLPDFVGVDSLETFESTIARNRKKRSDELGIDLQDAPTLPWLLGQVGHGAMDPTSYIPVGGGAAKGASILGKILSVAGREAAANAGMALALEPLVRRDAAAMGEERGWRDTVADVSLQGLTGGVIGAVAKSVDVGARPLAEWMAPEWMRRRDADAFGAKLGDAIDGTEFDDDVPLATIFSPNDGFSRDRAAAAGSLDDRELIRDFEDEVPPERQTREEKQAVGAVARGAASRESSPFEPGVAGDDANARHLQNGFQKIHGEPPVATVRPARRGVAISRDETIRFVMNDLEGGAAVVRYGQKDGGTTKWGIAAKFNKGVDVAKLTEGQAAAIARRDYWFAGLDEAPPATAAVAFDAGFIGGPKVGKRILAASGGDPERAIALYRAHLNHIADTVEGKAKYRKGWNRRVDRLAERLGLAGNGRADPMPELAGMGEARAVEEADEPVTHSAASTVDDVDVGEYYAPSAILRRDLFDNDDDWMRAHPAMWRDSGGAPDASSYVDAYLRGEGRGDTPRDLELQQFAANEGPAIEAEFRRRAEPSPGPSPASFSEISLQPVERTVTIPTSDMGNIDVPATVIGDLAVHRTIEDGQPIGKQWTISHIPSGLSVRNGVPDTPTGTAILKSKRATIEFATAWADRARGAWDELREPMGIDSRHGTPANAPFYDHVRGVGRAIADGQDRALDPEVPVRPAPDALVTDAVQAADVRASLRSADFDDPVGPAASAQADSIEHDLRMDVAAGHDATFHIGEGDPRSVSALLAEIDEEAASVEALRRCMAPAR